MIKYSILNFLKNNSFLAALCAKFASLLKNNNSNTFVLIKQDGKKVYNPKIKNLKLFFGGVNNYFEIHEPIVIEKELKVRFMKDNANFKIDPCSWISNMNVALDANSEITIGKCFSARSLSITTNAAVNKSIKIGDYCMVSYEVLIRNSDAHIIFDKNTKEILNKPKDVVIGNHVWLCAKSNILKGAKISSNSVVGCASVVSKEFDESNVILAGVPAKIVKRNIDWSSSNDFGLN